MPSRKKKLFWFANSSAFGKTLYWDKFWSCASFYSCGLWHWLQSTLGLAKDYREEMPNHALVDKSLAGIFQDQFEKEDVECPVLLAGLCDITQILWVEDRLLESKLLFKDKLLFPSEVIHECSTLLCFTMDAHYMPQSFSQWQNKSASLWLILNFQTNWTYWGRRSQGEYLNSVQNYLLVSMFALISALFSIEFSWAGNSNTKMMK